MRGLRHLGRLLVELFGFARRRKAWWIIPIVAILLLLILFVAASSTVAPFIYPLF
jgi:uncharacterized integral membrane protein